MDWKANEWLKIFDFDIIEQLTINDVLNMLEASKLMNSAVKFTVSGERLLYVIFHNNYYNDIPKNMIDPLVKPEDWFLKRYIDIPIKVPIEFIRDYFENVIDSDSELTSYIYGTAFTEEEILDNWDFLKKKINILLKNPKIEMTPSLELFLKLQNI
jgi:hypothetical protein